MIEQEAPAGGPVITSPAHSGRWPPARLAPVPGRLQPMARAIWAVLLAVVVIAEAGGIWLALAALQGVPAADRPAAAAFTAFNVTANLLGWLGLVAAATMLLRKRNDPVALLLSLSLLAGAGSLASLLDFYGQAGLGWLDSVMPALWIGLAAAALPAFPDGRYQPRWGAWVALAALALTPVIMFDEIIGDLSTMLGFALIGAALAAMVVRYRRTPPGLERQQLKWAGFGFISGMLVLFGSFIAISFLDAGVVPESWTDMLAVALLAGFYLCFLLIAAGLLVSLLRYRLWDADSAIGRSLGYAGVTIVAGGVFAASTTALNELVSSTVGDKTLIAAISTTMSALVYAPARRWLNAGVERKFRPGLASLARLPERLQLWQHDAGLERLGERTTAALVEGLHAGHAALLIVLGGNYHVIGATGIDPERVTGWRDEMLAPAEAATPRRQDPTDPVFPWRIIFADGAAPIGALLLGLRTDGSSYAKDERAMIARLEPALAVALRAAQLRSTGERELAERIARLEAIVNSSRICAA